MEGWSPPPLRLPAAEWGGGGGSGGVGDGVSFHDLRPYRPGDDLRHLHLPLYARRGELSIKQHEREARGALLMWVDATASMGAPLARWSLALELCEALAEGALRGGHAVGVWREGGGALTLYPLTPSRRAVAHALSDLRAQPPSGGPAPLTALRAAALRAPPRAALVHLSDLCGALTPDELVGRARLAPPRRGPRLTLALRDPSDLTPPVGGAFDPETGVGRGGLGVGGLARFRASLEGRYEAWRGESARLVEVWVGGEGRDELMRGLWRELGQ